MESSPIPAGLTLDWTYGSAGATYRVKYMTQGTASNEVIVVFTSSTLSTGWSVADATFPPPNAYGEWVCGPDKGQVCPVHLLTQTCADTMIRDRILDYQKQYA